MKWMMIALMAAGLVACGDGSADKSSKRNTQTPTQPPPNPGGTAKPAGEPDSVEVQHVLISFKDTRLGQGPGAKEKPKNRTREQAEEFAKWVLKRAKEPDTDFEVLVKAHTDDSPPGIYKMVNHGVAMKPGYMQRTGLVAAFGNVGFKLKVGEVGMAEYHATDSPFGWHIIKRLK